MMSNIKDVPFRFIDHIMNPSSTCSSHSLLFPVIHSTNCQYDVTTSEFLNTPHCMHTLTLFSLNMPVGLLCITLALFLLQSKISPQLSALNVTLNTDFELMSEATPDDRIKKLLEMAGNSGRITSEQLILIVINHTSEENQKHYFWEDL